ncbi:MAG TPA: nucleotidyltransferase domain-containing protein [Candidatus Dormibacteraeota bacterium]|jgi:predicted nucleotidyltransferase|nr:nucleotidyltransferase domain-containing protein [Candidatus Dormibacteraeota bacterium]
MDFTRPVEALIPGVQGRVLGVLSRTEAQLTIRAVADLAGVSPRQASAVVARLADLGVVERREVPPAVLVRLVPDNLAAETIMALARIRGRALRRLADLARMIRPRPAGLVVFGSFARGLAGPESDLDVLVVRPAGVSGMDDTWTETLGAWQHAASRLLGNPVQLLVVGSEELPSLLRDGRGVWNEIRKEGLVLLGNDLEGLSRAPCPDAET